MGCVQLVQAPPKSEATDVKHEGEQFLCQPATVSKAFWYNLAGVIVILLLWQIHTIARRTLFIEFSLILLVFTNSFSIISLFSVGTIKNSASIYNIFLSVLDIYSSFWNCVEVSAREVIERLGFKLYLRINDIVDNIWPHSAESVERFAFPRAVHQQRFWILICFQWCSHIAIQPVNTSHSFYPANVVAIVVGTVFIRHCHIQMFQMMLSISCFFVV